MMAMENIKTITINEINEYRSLLIDEMLKIGATEDDVILIKDATIRNAIKRKRKPEDVAWAILQ